MAVCLHCLHADRVAAQERRQRLLIRVSLGLITVAVVAAAGSAGLGALRSRDGIAAATKSERAPARKVSTPAVTVAMTSAMPAASMPVTQQGAIDSTSARPAPLGATTSVRPPAITDTIAGLADQQPSAGVSNATPVPKTTPAPAALPVPIVPLGRSELPESLYVERTGDTVVVHFDTSPSRTRRANKFERIVRQTLPVAFGAAADSALATVADGALASHGDLLTELPTRGIHLRTVSGWRLSLWPETRPGRDGPLVVAYRAVVGR